LFYSSPHGIRDCYGDPNLREGVGLEGNELPIVMTGIPLYHNDAAGDSGRLLFHPVDDKRINTSFAKAHRSKVIPTKRVFRSELLVFLNREVRGGAMGSFPVVIYFYRCQ
jgi:hypothetical protein